MANIERVSQLAYVSFVERSKYGFKSLYRCSCGNEKVYLDTHVRTKRVLGCGCLRKKSGYDTSKRNITHGFSNTSIYKRWKGIMIRCYNPNYRHYKDYGGRGIIVCDEWHDIKIFGNWCLANGYKKELQIDRKDNDGNYTPSNCRFVTPLENVNNRGCSIKFTIMGIEKTGKEWCRSFGISYYTFFSRYTRGQNKINKLFATPLKKAS